ncbi:piggyBac transposable element-derived protein 3-like [Coccinella septempunctata]|uniref:piggyBac transposable element-derived protein 3-like n=1 Tax=Coccinella septempunctata TaxID=41139 RepID=UPI001D08A6ED|nr:piggyBac transposable element-derived protein 3-like [Coccinella septempunctata]
MSHIDMPYAQGLKLASGVTLHDVLSALEDIDDGEIPQECQINILPPLNCNNDLTDEDSGEENLVSIDNLPGSQLLAEAKLKAINSDSDDEEDNIPLKFLQISSKKYQKNREWQNVDLTTETVEWAEMTSAVNNSTPLELFEYFFDKELVDMFVGYTNIYSAKRNRIGSVSQSEMKSFFGILLLSGYIPLPRRRMYWENSKDSHNNLVVNALSRDKFEFIMSNLHCCDNDLLDKDDRFAKIRPLLNLVNQNSLKHAPHSENHSVDESMVPYFGKHGCKQCILNKPIRFGFKMWLGCSSKGYVNWIEPYQGAKSVIKSHYKEFGLGPSVVLEYSDVLRKLGPHPYHIFCDNFFITIPLLEALSMKNLRCTGTIRENRLCGCPLTEKKAMKKKERGYFEYMSSDNKIIVTKWNDNNVICIASNCDSTHPVQMISRFSKIHNKKVAVTQPQIIKNYNQYMGGVDRCDQNISLYRTNIRGKKWYFTIICYCLDIIVQNAWQLHRLQNGKLDQLTFRRRIVLALLESNTESRKRGRPSSLENVDSRFDRIDHLVSSQEKQTRCRVCHKKVKTKCVKCDVALHIDCFISYHKQ